MPPRRQKLRLDCGLCTLRSWEPGDRSSLIQHANSPNVALNLRDSFPSPYTEDDAITWLEQMTGPLAGRHWAIDVEGAAVGGIGLTPEDDLHQGTTEIGYWLGEAWWGRGIATAAVATLTRHALTRLGFRRVYATTLLRNAASQRVLEKAGYVREGVLRRSAIKQGVVLDQAIYSFVDTDLYGMDH